MLPRRRLTLSLSLLALGAWTAMSVAVAQEADLDAVLSRAVELHQSGDLEGASALYVQVLRAVPSAWRVRSNLGAAWAGLGRYEDAIDQYRQALQQEDDSSIRRNMAVALLKTGRTREAGVEAERALLAQPQDRDALLILADCRLRLGETQAAIDILQPAAAAAPGDKAVAYLLGTALLDSNRVGDAQVVMDRVFRDDSPESHVLLGSMYARRGEWPAAVAEYDKARAANPKLPLVNFLYGEALMKERNDWAGAAAAFRAELEIDPNHYESNLLLGTLLREGGQADEALRHLEHAARLRGDDLAVKFSLGAAYLAMERLEEARRLLEAVGQAAPGHLPTQMQLAVLYTRLGRPEDAAQARTNVMRLTKEADARSFQGVRESVSDLMGKSGDPAAAGKKP
ncbi:MAG TPA: tetratricopeptide repeat protein [Vicinamibacteria bacterium]|nr:tetratricopeptide repeat protein [Vicinamibacteria bacterium]